MVCLLIGYRILDKSQLSIKLHTLPSSLREGLLTGYTDYDKEDFVGYCILDMGIHGIDRVSGPIDLPTITSRISQLGAELGYGLDQSQVAEIYTSDLPDC